MDMKMSQSGIKKATLKNVLKQQGYHEKEIAQWLVQWDDYDLVYRKTEIKTESFQARKDNRDDYENIFSQKEMNKIVQYYQKLKNNYPEMEIETNFSLNGDVTYFIYKIETKEELVSRLLNTMKIQKEFKALNS
jgi:hypothetical protein